MWLLSGLIGVYMSTGGSTLAPIGTDPYSSISYYDSAQTLAYDGSRSEIMRGVYLTRER